jgi:2-dehydropantoate 2-reductase
MRYIIIGAGAIGGGLAARLAQNSPEHPPLLIARGEHGAAIRENGLRLRTPDEDTYVAIEVAAGPDEVRLRDDDVLIFATKTQQVRDALAQWVDQPVFDESDQPIGTAGERLPVFLALNGVASERIALRLFERVFGICVWMPSVHLTPGEIILRIAPISGVLIIGRYGDGADDADLALLSTIQNDWMESTYDIHVVNDVMHWKYAKLLANLGNAAQALLAPSEDETAVVARLREEAEAVLVAADIHWASDEEEAVWRQHIFTIRDVPGTPDQLGGSSWQSLARGSGSIETDYLNGEIAYLARSMGQDAPLNATIQRLARQAAAAGTPVGAMTIAELQLPPVAE